MTTGSILTARRVIRSRDRSARSDPARRTPYVGRGALVSARCPATTAGVDQVPFLTARSASGLPRGGPGAARGGGPGGGRPGRRLAGDDLAGRGLRDDGLRRGGLLRRRLAGGGRRGAGRLGGRGPRRRGLAGAAGRPGERGFFAAAFFAGAFFAAVFVAVDALVAAFFAGAFFAAVVRLRRRGGGLLRGARRLLRGAGGLLRGARGLLRARPRSSSRRPWSSSPRRWWSSSRRPWSSSQRRWGSFFAAAGALAGRLRGGLAGGGGLLRRHLLRRGGRLRGGASWREPWRRRWWSSSPGRAPAAAGTPSWRRPSPPSRPRRTCARAWSGSLPVFRSAAAVFFAVVRRAAGRVVACCASAISVPSLGDVLSRASSRSTEYLGAGRPAPSTCPPRPSGRPRRPTPRCAPAPVCRAFSASAAEAYGPSTCFAGHTSASVSTRWCRVHQ